MENKMQNLPGERKVRSRAKGQPFRIGLSHFIEMPVAHNSEGQTMVQSLIELCSPTMGNNGPSEVLACDRCVIR